MQDENILAWAAGLVDGEGCIMIRKNKPTRGAKNFLYGVRVSLSMTHIPTVERLHQIFQGNLTGYNYDLANKRLRSQLRWEVSGSDAKEFLELIMPFLYTKRDEAVLALEFLKLPSGTSFRESPGWLLDAKEGLYKKLRATKFHNYDISKYKAKKNKRYKKDAKTTCEYCGKPINAYHANGRRKKFCSVRCSKFSVPTENIGEITRDRLSGMTIRSISEKYSVPYGTLKDLFAREGIRIRKSKKT